MFGFVLALLALLCFLLALFSADVGIDLVTLGFVFIAAYFVVGSAPVAKRVN